MKNYPKSRFVCLMALTAICAACQTTTKTTYDVPQFGDSNPVLAVKFVDYSSPDGKFHTKYDGVWNPQPGISSLNLRYIYSDLGALSEMTINIPSMPTIASHLPGLITYDAVQDGYIKEMKTHVEQVQVVKTADQMLDGVKGRRVQITAQENHESKLFDVLFVIRDAQVYIINTDCSAGGIDISRHAMQTVIDYWKWK